MTFYDIDQSSFVIRCIGTVNGQKSADEGTFSKINELYKLRFTESGMEFFIAPGLFVFRTS